MEGWVPILTALDSLWPPTDPLPLRRSQLFAYIAITWGIILKKRLWFSMSGVGPGALHLSSLVMPMLLVHGLHFEQQTWRMLFLQVWSVDNQKSCRSAFQYMFWLQHQLTKYFQAHYVSTGLLQLYQLPFSTLSVPLPSRQSILLKTWIRLYHSLSPT